MISYLGAKHVILSTAEARDVVVNDKGGPSSLGHVALVDSLTVTNDLLETNYTFEKVADVKMVVRGPTQFQQETYNVTQAAMISWYPVEPGMTAEVASSRLPYIMKVPGTVRQQRGKEVATFLFLKHMCLKCDACDKIGHSALAPTCGLSPTSVVRDPFAEKRRARERDINMMARNVRPRY